MPQKRKAYSESTLQVALKEIDGGASYRSVAIKYKIPRSTLQNRRSGKTQYQERPGPKVLKLNVEYEKALVDWIIKLNESGEQIRKSMIAKYAKDNFNCEGKFSHGWYRSFFNRNPEIQKFFKNIDVQPHYGMDIKATDAYIINQIDEIIESSEESNLDNHELVENSINNIEEINCKFELISNDLLFEKNERVKVALCFACTLLIEECNENAGIRCSSCLRTYHLKCANKQSKEVNLFRIEEVFTCLVCWKKTIKQA